ncbi:hypothetical protein N9J72_01255 [Candidatus Gracilibacteria bacterium]|nr:hypothetical protein [Candidatus Gracilibacteria bacterium]
MSFGPKSISFQDVALNSLGALIAGFIGSIIILLIVFAVSGFLSVPGSFEQAQLGGPTNPMFPFVLSFITFIATMVTLMLSALLIHMTDPERYSGSRVSYGQLAFFGILTYICITPIYIATGILDYNNIMIVFIAHCVTLAFGSSLLLELLNNYRYVLTGFYGSFIGLFFTVIFVISIFVSMGEGYARLISLLIMLPLINTSLVFFKGVFELGYFHYNRLTNLDQLGDIFYQIEQEEKESLREEEQKNSL